jgi:hypothetical protein
MRKYSGSKTERDMLEYYTGWLHFLCYPEHFWLDHMICYILIVSPFLSARALCLPTNPTKARTSLLTRRILNLRG